MRTGGCTLQQALTPDALIVIQQATTLARRRGHAQVTPLHVAKTMLTAPTCLLRTACLQSHSHPLQCKALELCFNVALNRLPSASNSSPMFGGASISNALVAAFKRAQAHQRRGSIENQQQSLLTVKIELEQLIISILDDPSVSRVMKEAGFLSTQVKSNVEQALSSLELYNKSTNPIAPFSETVRNEDVAAVTETLMEKRGKNLVVVGERVASVERVVQLVFEKIGKKEVDQEELREVKIINISLSSFGHFSRAEVEEKLVEIRNHVRGCLGKGVVLYLGDLKWVSEYRAGRSEKGGKGYYYCPVEHMTKEFGKLGYGIGENNNNNNNNDDGRIWVMGIATFQTYMKCKIGNPSLETVWGLHPLTIPAGSFSLSLNTLRSSSEKFEKGSDGGEDKQLSTKESEGSRSSPCKSDSTTSTLPAWLQRYKNEREKPNMANDQDCVSVSDLCRRWNSISNSSDKSPTFSSSISPSSSASASTFSNEPNYLRMHISEHLKQAFASNPGSNPASASSSDVMDVEYVQKFSDLNSDNLKTLCNALEIRVPWQKHIVPEIARTVLQCRSRMVGRIGNCFELKEDTWFLFQGTDFEGKEKIGRELGRLVFGSQASNFVSIALSSFLATQVDSTKDCRNKRYRDERTCSYIERFAEAVSINPHRVFLIEDVDQADYSSRMGFKRAIERGKVTNSIGDQISLCDAIIILSCESFSRRSRACSPHLKLITKGLEDKNIGLLEGTSPRLSLDLNISVADENDINVDFFIDDVGVLELVDRWFVLKKREL